MFMARPQHSRARLEALATWRATARVVSDRRDTFLGVEQIADDEHLRMARQRAICPYGHAA